MVFEPRDDQTREEAAFFYRGGSETIAEGVVFFPSFGTSTTFVCDGANGRFFQITKNNEIVWEYINPFVTSPRYQGAVYKAHHYRPGFCPQFSGLKPAKGPAVGRASE